MRMSLRISYANVASTLALVVALGGGAYAVTSLPSDSVGTAQIKNYAVTGQKIYPHIIGNAQLTTAIGGKLNAPVPVYGATVPSHKSLYGEFVVQSGGNMSYGNATISFGQPFAAGLAAQEVLPGGAATVQCPGSVAHPAAAPGYFCLYDVQDGPSLVPLEVYSLETTSTAETKGHTGRFGAYVIARGDQALSYLALVSGDWAATAP